jgi:hypothetical protein
MRSRDKRWVELRRVPTCRLRGQTRTSEGYAHLLALGESPLSSERSGESRMTIPDYPGRRDLFPGAGAVRTSFQAEIVQMSTVELAKMRAGLQYQWQVGMVDAELALRTR